MLFIVSCWFLHVSQYSLVGPTFLHQHFLINGIFRLSRPKAGDRMVQQLGH